AEVIKNYNSTIVNAYTLKTGMKKNDLLEMMNKETWLTPEKALEYKFVDEIMFQEESRMVASYNNMIPIEVINKIRNTVKGPINSENGESDILMSKYNYLKLKGECKDEF
uniref:ATP-dependent Clp protease proteolytic subunit n=1 Tax=Clostridium sp. TaxID=1506 RepID=UPI0035A066D2